MGFCRGVRAAIDTAVRASRLRARVYCLGPLIHNSQVVDRLSRMGLRVVHKVEDLDSGPVLIPSHGVDATTVEQAQTRQLEVIDATCATVRHAQNQALELQEKGYRVVVVGDPDHPEVKGIVSRARGATVVNGPHDIDELPQNLRLGVVGQTTLAQSEFVATVAQILARPFREVRVVNTLCGEVAARLAAAVELCRCVDVMFVLGGRHSANTRALAEACRKQGVPTYHLEDWSSFCYRHIEGRRIAGVTAGASTPDWIIDEFVEQLEQVEVAELANRK
jgi:(E)-4-hydroxy-3-methyl-but-2-enyl pyrophosphate reductase